MSLPLNTPTELSISLNNRPANGEAVSTGVDNTEDGFERATISVSIRSGTIIPTAGETYDLFLVRGDNKLVGALFSDNWDGTASTVFVRENAPFLGSIVVTPNNNKDFSDFFDTWKMGPLGPIWGISFLNGTSGSTHATPAFHTIRYMYTTPDRVA